MFLCCVVIVGILSNAKMKLCIFCSVVLRVSKYCTALLLLRFWSPDSFLFIVQLRYLVLQSAGKTEEIALCAPPPLDH